MRQLAPYIFGCAFAIAVSLAAVSVFTHAVARFTAYFPGH